jgi:DNA-binding SARP family transcriptional activator/tetratricopeptide (TPR) repeat protein
VRVPGNGVLERERVNCLFDRITSFRASMVIAPAGSGKTTALMQFAARTHATVLWARTDSLDGSAEALVAHLDALHSNAMGSEPAGWTLPRDVGAGIARSGATPLVVVIDDFHLIRDRPAAGVVDELLATLPPGAHLVLSSRSLPSFDVSRLILSSDVHEIGADDLRFRTWETERLINQIYHLALGPEDVARLTRRVEGWAAGLQLYHLAVRSKSPSEQRRLIDVASSRSSLARQYLTRNVLHDLPTDVREFLLLTSVLGVVSGPIADEFLGRSGSHAILRHLHELQLFVTPIGSESAVRYHEVLRSHLETELGEEIGHDELIRRFGAAAPLLERSGFTGESLRCWARAGRWDEVSRLVGAGGSDPLDQLYDWLDLLPSGVADDDPWLLQARARSELARGRLYRAIAHYRRAEQLFGESDAVVSCQVERLNLESFLDAFATDPPGWLGVLRRGLRTAPLESAEALRHLDDPLAQLAAGLLCLCAGDQQRAIDHLDAVLLDDSAARWTVVAAHLASVVIRLLDPIAPAQTDELDAIARQQEHDWFARMARALLALTDRTDGPADARTVAHRCHVDGDPWGEMLATLCAGLGDLRAGRPCTNDLSRAAELARQLQMTVVEVLAFDASSIAVDRPHGEAAIANSRRADHARRLLSPGAVLVPSSTPALQRALLGDTVTPHITIDATAALTVRSGTAVAGSTTDRLPVAASPNSRAAATEVRCFGHFVLTGPDGPADLSPLRPRSRSLVHLLARHAGAVVHSDVLRASLWPDATSESGRRSLQVAVSAARKTIEHVGGAIVREGDGYLLVVQDGAADVVMFDRSFRDLERASTVDTDEGRARVLAAAQQCLGLYTGELLAEEGAAEWVIRDRENYRLSAASAARMGATAAIRQGDSTVALALAERGLVIDHFDDTLWHLLIDLHQQRGEVGAAAHVRNRYRAALDELGVAVPPVIISSAGTPAP